MSVESDGNFSKSFLDFVITTRSIGGPVLIKTLSRLKLESDIPITDYDASCEQTSILFRKTLTSFLSFSSAEKLLFFTPFATSFKSSDIPLHDLLAQAAQ